MGALRAAECCALGMVGIGSIFEDYASGSLLDDEAVALAHAPAELEWMPLSEPWVNFEATVRKAAFDQSISSAEADLLALAGKHIHYTERTYKAVIALCSDIDDDRRKIIVRILAAASVDRKREDAWAVAHWLTHVLTPLSPTEWKLSRTSHWLALANSIDPMATPDTSEALSSRA